MGDLPGALLERAEFVWARAQVLYEAPPRLGEPEALRLVEEVAQRPECEEGLVGQLGSPKPLVVAYALLTLRRMGSPVLAELPDALLNRRENVAIQCGCIRNGMDLGGLARQYRKQARRRAGPGAAADRPRE
jgi:hypothetical protein